MFRTVFRFSSRTVNRPQRIVRAASVDPFDRRRSNQPFFILAQRTEQQSRFHRWPQSRQAELAVQKMERRTDGTPSRRQTLKRAEPHPSHPALKLLHFGVFPVSLQDRGRSIWHSPDWGFDSRPISSKLATKYFQDVPNHGQLEVSVIERMFTSITSDVRNLSRR
jgi:hypothetical protein